jgi:hypothetical protein
MSVALADAIAAGQQALEELRSMIPGETREAIGPVNLNELLRDVLDLSTSRLLAAGITVSWKPQAMLPALQGAPNKLRSLFKALIDNAIEAMNTRGCRERELTLASKERLGGNRGAHRRLPDPASTTPNISRSSSHFTPPSVAAAISAPVWRRRSRWPLTTADTSRSNRRAARGCRVRVSASTPPDDHERYAVRRP